METHPDKPAYAVLGDGGGGTHVYHWNENRALTNREQDFKHFLII